MQVKTRKRIHSAVPVYVDGHHIVPPPVHHTTARIKYLRAELGESITKEEEKARNNKRWLNHVMSKPQLFIDQFKK